MKFISLIDTNSQNIITVDFDALIFRLEISGYTRETRLKPYHAEILYALFNSHPVALSYDQITDLLKLQNLVISDLTRMHRKISEIRNFLLNFHPSLGDLILNIRGVGYSLSLRMKNLQHLENNQITQFKDAKLAESIAIISGLINDSIEFTSEIKVIRHHQGYVMNRDSIRHLLIQKISAFNKCETVILKQIRMHEADFISLRVQYLLAKLKTFIGLARISEYPISETQWLDWFKQEVWSHFEDLKKLIKYSETQ